MIWVEGRLEGVGPPGVDCFTYLPLLGAWGFAGTDARSFSGPVRLLQGSSEKDLGHQEVSIGHGMRGGFFLASRPKSSHDLEPPYLLTDSASVRVVYDGQVQIRPNPSWAEGSAEDPSRLWRVKGKAWTGVLRVEGKSGGTVIGRVNAFSSNPASGARVEGEIFLADHEDELLGSCRIS